MLELSLLVLVALANAGLSFAVVRNAHYSGSENAAQMVLLWMLPVLGAALVFAFLRSDRRHDAAQLQPSHARPGWLAGPVPADGHPGAPRSDEV